MKLYICRLTLFLLIPFLLSCSTQKSKKTSEENSPPDFGSMEMIGDKGTEGYELLYSGNSDVEPFRKALLKRFGKPDTIKGSHIYKWNEVDNDSLYSKPINLVINASEVSTSDGKPSGEYWITIKTPENEMLLKPDSKSYTQIKSYFDKMKEQALTGN